MTTIERKPNAGDIRYAAGLVLDDEIVGRYIGITAEQVRLMRLHKLTCPDCANVHPSYPQIKAFHSPCCKGQRKCASCGKDMLSLDYGHEVGLICWDCYEGKTPKDTQP